MLLLTRKVLCSTSHFNWHCYINISISPAKLLFDLQFSLPLLQPSFLLLIFFLSKILTKSLASATHNTPEPCFSQEIQHLLLSAHDEICFHRMRSPLSLLQSWNVLIPLPHTVCSVANSVSSEVYHKGGMWWLYLPRGKATIFCCFCFFKYQIILVSINWPCYALVLFSGGVYSWFTHLSLKFRSYYALF